MPSPTRVFNQNPSVFVFSVTLLALTLIYVTAQPDAGRAAAVFKPTLSLADMDDDDATDVPASFSVQQLQPGVDEIASGTDFRDSGYQLTAEVNLESRSNVTAAAQATVSVEEGIVDETGPVRREVRKVLEHGVEPGESLWQIARLYRTTVSNICELNDILDSDPLQAGQRLKVEKVTKLCSYIVRPGDTLSTIAMRLNTSVSTLQRLNNIHNANLLMRGQELCVSREQFLDWPLRRFRLSSSYGMRLHPILRKRMMHRGVDFGAKNGEPIFAAADGEVIFSGWRFGTGKLIKIRHSNGMDTLYAHCSRILVTNGQKIVKGQKIGLVGSTGLSTGPHLHFGVKFGKKYYDPMKFL